ncbi:MAG: hypothetical protein ACOX6H_04520 [Christensenellales bacterium]|jgi:hypothetical protein
MFVYNEVIFRKNRKIKNIKAYERKYYDLFLDCLGIMQYEFTANTFVKKMLELNSKFVVALVKHETLIENPTEADIKAFLLRDLKKNLKNQFPKHKCFLKLEGNKFIKTGFSQRDIQFLGIVDIMANQYLAGADILSIDEIHEGLKLRKINNGPKFTSAMLNFFGENFAWLTPSTNQKLFALNQEFINDNELFIKEKAKMILNQMAQGQNGDETAEEKPQAQTEKKQYKEQRTF